VCRLFGLCGGPTPASAAFWLLDAPDSLDAESRRNPDGFGIGWFDASGHPRLDKHPDPAYGDPRFAAAAHSATSRSIVAHVRLATTGAHTVENTHPFLIRGRLMAHNGGFSDLDRMDAELGDYRRLVLGDTDSERMLALITKRTDENGGDVTEGIVAATRWIAANLPLYSLNLVLVEDGQLWALRYPDQRALHVLAGRRGTGTWRAAETGVRVRLDDPADAPTVVVASERLDDGSEWRMLAPGELLHVRPDLTVDSRVVLPDPPARFLVLDEHDPNIDT
jgi:predicted glutamine amidotransferase